MAAETLMNLVFEPFPWRRLALPYLALQAISKTELSEIRQRSVTEALG